MNIQQHGASQHKTRNPATICHMPDIKQSMLIVIIPRQFANPKKIATEINETIILHGRLIIYIKYVLILPTVPKPLPAYLIHQGTSSLALGSCPGLAIREAILSEKD